MRAAYTGNETLTFSQYIDTGTGKTLHAEPGGVYEITPASGHEVPEIPVPWFEWIEDDAAWDERKAAFAAPRVVPAEDGGDPQPGGESDAAAETGPWHDHETDPAEG